ncbi:P-loop containing nucleoside triphosphate hydrolase protein [Cokeromyces recurvatus]|uniref:P-loop containing nucleoside triphosphate hydrolase protein n=1 Tax=Cokeromyces recurvatus TaxID=90255 RepID=UPI00222044EF|nr:P-loop containing nucleoside triphosphate hydrolase protein [Cokeromyces recurvatus]KAI7902530.1 P-loop containing nucleoside triphosphate hydrolase protein [Cokeromyces recurvatus]
MFMSTNDKERKQQYADMLAYLQRQREANEQNKKESEGSIKQSLSPPDKKIKTTLSASKPRMTKPKSALPDYVFNSDKTCNMLELPLRPEVEIRPYQREALEAIVDTSDPDPTKHFARSGIIVLPCGAGKTLTSILVACAIQKPVLVVCSTIIAAEQFCKEFLRFTTLMASKTGMFAGAKKWPYNGPSGVLFTTYTMLVENKNRTADSKRMSNFIDKTEWGLIILDEVHCVPANNFAKAISKIKTKVRLGLTATMLREDERIGDLETLVGPTLYHAKWKELADKGYIAKVICTQIEADMTPHVHKAHESIQTQGGGLLGHGHHLKSLLAILNPKKMQICQRLIQYHEFKGDKVLVYCDHIDALKLYAEKINRPFIYGGTPTEEARQLLARFQIDVPETDEELTWNQVAARRSLKAKQINTLFLSRIGDTSLDLPAATVLIQVSSHFGSRRQEAQRLGRVLRAKKRNEKGFYSRFYTLVTNDTHEVTFSEKRRQFLEEDCGYGYQIWKVGKEEEGGWEVEAHRDNSSPDDDEVKTDPLTCTVKGVCTRPYASEEEEKQLIHFLTNLKNYQVEEDEEELASEPGNVSGATGSKRKR